MSEALDAALRHAFEKMMRAGPRTALSDPQPVVDAIRAIIREETKGAVTNNYSEPDLKQIRLEIERRGFAGYECILLEMIDKLQKVAKP